MANLGAIYNGDKPLSDNDAAIFAKMSVLDDSGNAENVENNDSLSESRAKHDAPPSNFEAALRLVGANFYIFPIQSSDDKGKDKAPIFVSSWSKESTRNPATPKRWFTNTTAMPAIDCGKSRIVVIDLDRHGGPDGVEHFMKIMGIRDLTELGCPVVETPGGGYHLIYMQPAEGEPIGCRKGAFSGLGIDIKANGGYVGAFGGVRHDGRSYRQMPGTLDPCEAMRNGSIPPLPAKIADMIRAPKEGPEDDIKFDAGGRSSSGGATVGARERAWAQAALAKKKAKLAQAPEGDRNNMANAIAYAMGRIVGAGWIPLDEVKTALADACRANGLAKEDPRGCAASLASGLNKGMESPRGPLPDRDFDDNGPRASSGAAGASKKAPNSNWSDPKPIQTELLPVPAFEPAFLPRSLADWAADIADRMQCPLDFVGVSALVAMGSIIGRKLAIRPQRRTDWCEVMNLWGCLIGRPGLLKSPAMKEALRFLNKLEAVARKENDEALAEFKRAERVYALKVKASERKAAKLNVDDINEDILAGDAPEPPRMRRYILNDTTYEYLGMALAHNPDGVLAFRDELISLLKYLDDERNASARGFYLTAWNGTSGYTFDRIVRGSTHIEAACLSLLGSTQPGRLIEYIRRSQGAGDNGMIQRFGLLSWPDHAGEWKEIDRYPDSDARKAAQAAFERLDMVTPANVGAEIDDFGGLPFLHFNEAAQEAFRDWRRGLEFRLRSGDLTPALESHLAKFRKLVPSLALTSHLADGGCGPITEGAVLRALAIAEYAEAHARRCYDAGSQTRVADANTILTHIRKGDLKEDFSLRDVMRKGWAGLSSYDQIDAALGLLEERGWIAPRTVQTGGRPSTVYSINPRALS